jgi:hypothetical protein
MRENQFHHRLRGSVLKNKTFFVECELALNISPQVAREYVTIFPRIFYFSEKSLLNNFATAHHNLSVLKYQ